MARRRTEAGLSLQQGPVVLEVSGLTKRFGGITATNDVSFKLHEGEILGFIGPNGAGKTTLFDLVSGFIAPDGGRVVPRPARTSPTSRPDARARLGLGRSFQDARLFPALTVRETIAIALERQIDVRDPVAAALHLPVVADAERAVDATRSRNSSNSWASGRSPTSSCRELSTGSRRIVDLACILAHEPSVILFDEPSSGIAQKETEALGPLLQRIRTDHRRQPARHRARHAAHHRHLRPDDRPRPRYSGHRRDAARRHQPPASRRLVSGDERKRHRPIGQQADKPDTDAPTPAPRRRRRPAAPPTAADKGDQR